MHAFIVRPFGIRSGIDFNRVERDLIRPALEQSGFTGGTTEELIQQGNIRADMFEKLMIADLVIADISIHNANVFYELGIRHALRDKRTFLIRSKADEVPFDLKTDRYLPYDAANPGASVEILASALKATWDSREQDSPVFQLLPGLEPSDPTQFLAVPPDFKEEVELAEASGNCADLQLFAAEVDGFAWKVAGLRLIGRAQFTLRDWLGSRVTWESVRKYDEADPEANRLLGTIYQRLGDFVQSDQAIERVMGNKHLSRWELAEALSLMARNAKSRWEADWRAKTEPSERQRGALASPHLERSLEFYRRGFVEDRNHYYSGLNALAMLTVLTALASRHSDIWLRGFDSDEEADRKLREFNLLRSELAVGVRLAIESVQTLLERQGREDMWADISAADLSLLTSTRPERVGQAYKKALSTASGFARDAVRNQLQLYQSLGILVENTKQALINIPSSETGQSTVQTEPRVILFTGHRIDVEGRAKPRFPRDKESEARAMIAHAVSSEKERVVGSLIGISGGASGGDILFHEVCEELGIPTRIFLVLPRSEYIRASVADSGADWVQRFKRLCDLQKPEILTDSAELPRWLRAKHGYDIWQRSNLWMLHHALSISKDNLTLIALWNGEVGDGPGGTDDMVKRAQDRGATFIHLDTKKFLQ